MIHYHGGPITPDTCAMRAWKGRHAFISFAHSGQINLAAEYCQSFALDNGAFTAWKAAGKNKIDWSDYYEFVARWKNQPGLDFAIIPDVIDGGEEENDASSAYKLGTYLYQKDNSCNLFNTLTEARDAIKDAYESYCGIDDCPQCSKYIDD